MKEEYSISDMPPDELQRASDQLRLLAHPQRLRIVDYLDRQGRTSGQTLCRELDLPQAAVSQHLNRMRRSGLLAGERRGREVRYRIADQRCVSILRCLRGRLPSMITTGREQKESR